MNHEKVLELLKKVGEAVCDKVTHSLRTQSVEQLSGVHKNEETDVIYNIDRDVEEIIVPMLEQYASELGGIVLLAEGIGDEHVGMVLPQDMQESEAKVRIIMDPIDGTRGIMYDKRAAFFLAGAAPNKGRSSTLQDIEVAVMTELPTSRGYLSDTLFAIKGRGTQITTRNILTGEITQKKVSPSKATTIIGGFAQLARFFPPGRAILAQIEDELIETIDPTLGNGRAVIFEDQYISTGGQLYELLMGHDRFIGDIRHSLYTHLATQGKKAGHVCHPYDICTILIANEAGLMVTNPEGEPLNAPMDLLSPVDWLGFANISIYNQVFPILRQLMKKYGLQ